MVFAVSGSHVLNTAQAAAGIDTTEVTSDCRRPLLTWSDAAVHSASDLHLCPPIQ